MLLTYLKSVGLLVGMIAAYGFLCPMLISSNSNELPILGVILLCVSVPLNIWGIYLVIMDIPRVKHFVSERIEELKRRM